MFWKVDPITSVFGLANLINQLGIVYTKYRWSTLPRGGEKAASPRSLDLSHDIPGRGQLTPALHGGGRTS
jgi:hypothetical protein